MIFFDAMTDDDIFLIVVIDVTCDAYTRNRIIMYYSGLRSLSRPVAPCRWPATHLCVNASSEDNPNPLCVTEDTRMHVAALTK